ncbi:diphthine-ammonia ligase, partial [Tremellales sp. Uapishka_1]
MAGERAYIDGLPGVKHKVIGLLSGGKDSCFNLMHCLANGHEMVAIATLIPEPGVDELDSYLYQSVGTQLLPLIAQAMGLPLHTRIIRGKALNTSAEYGDRTRGGEGSGTQGDETEDLTELLEDVLRSHPDATALSSGAILSTYQRLRIEHVCSRLSLTSLSYLWQTPQLTLLDQLAACQVDAILVKVAGVGLGADVVGQSLTQVRPLLNRLARQFGAHPAGEGGEYETLTLSTPLFSHRLEIVKSEVIVSDPEPHLVAYMKVEEARLVEKPGWRKPTVRELREMIGLDEQDGLDDEGREALEELEKENLGSLDGERATIGSIREETIDEKVRYSRHGGWFCVSINGRTRGNESIGEELRRCFDAVSATLSSHSLSLPVHATHITLLLSSLSDFVPANKEYITYFGTSPPSRATVGVPLPENQRVKLEVVGFKHPSARETRSCLHVQSLSYWAPANIGPYSQAVLAESHLSLAGVIPLIPASLTLPPNSSYGFQSTLALQHIRRIIAVLKSKDSTGGGWDGWGESCVGWYVGDGAAVVRKAWALWVENNGFTHAPVMFVRAKELPKGSLVEFQTCLDTGRRDDNDEDDDDEGEAEAVYNQGGGHEVWWESCSCSSSKGGRAMIFIAGSITDSQLEGDIAGILRRGVSLKVYHVPGSTEIERVLHLVKSTESKGCITMVPVLAVSDRKGRECTIGLEIFGP